MPGTLQCRHTGDRPPGNPVQTCAGNSALGTLHALGATEGSEAHKGHDHFCNLERSLGCRRYGKKGAGGRGQE